MKFLSDRYAAILEHKGIAICVLKVAVPAEGDELGYTVDHELFQSKVFNHPGDAVNVIDLFF